MMRWAYGLVFAVRWRKSDFKAVVYISQLLHPSSLESFVFDLPVFLVFAGRFTAMLADLDMKGAVERRRQRLMNDGFNSSTSHF